MSGKLFDLLSVAALNSKAVLDIDPERVITSLFLRAVVPELDECDEARTTEKIAEILDRDKDLSLTIQRAVKRRMKGIFKPDMNNFEIVLAELNRTAK